MNNKFFQALAVLMGTIIGVGLFSLPYITVQVGIITMLFYFLILGIVMILVSLIYGEVALRTKELHRLPGYAEKYLGAKAKKIAFISNGFGLGGALLAYLIVGGEFLFSILSPVFNGTSFTYTLIFFSLGAILIYFGVKSIAQAELILLVLFFVILGIVFYYGFPLINTEHLFNFNFKYIFLPYGAVLFSLAGISVIPEIKEILINDSKKLKKVIISGILISILTYLFFIILITGITGPNTSSEAIIGLKNILSNNIVALALIFGLLTIFTSFLTIGLTLKKILWYDLEMNKNLSWFLACFIPLLFFIFGLKNFIAVISLTGGVFLGIDVILIILSYLKAKTKGDQKPAYSLKIPNLLVYSLILFFILGIVYEFIALVKV
ncbi:MAG: amino acid permease [Candidatus Portnoybacteria bacterium]|nr:amino acid permease [Candidatus Portnoybacteria bacterium]